MSVWYRVRDMAAARAFYKDVLGFEERYADEDGRWARLRRDDMEIALWEAQGDEGGVASISVVGRPARPAGPRPVAALGPGRLPRIAVRAARLPTRSASPRHERPAHKGG